MISATYGTPFSLTSDGGQTWKNRNELSGQNRDADPVMFSADTLLYISVNKKLIYTYNGAQSWIIFDDARGITGDIASVVYYDRIRGICITTDGAMFRTTDGGSHWVANILDSATTNINLNIYGEYTIGYGSKESVILSSDQGSTWRTIRFSDSIYTPNFMKIMNGKIYISTASNRWYITDLNGQILMQEYLGVNSEVKRFAFPNENELWAADRTRGVKVSVPGSGNWVASGFPEQRNIYSIYESFNGLVLVSLYDVESGLAMMQQRNPGKNYSVRNGKLPGNYRLSSVKIVNPGLTFVGSYDGIIFRSTDMGIHWEATTGNNIYPAITDITFKNSSVIFAGCDGGYILKSTDSGLSWILVKTNITEKITGIEYKQVDSLFITTESKVYTTTISNPSMLVQINPNIPPNGRIYKIKFWDRNIGYIGANTKSIYTLNGGKSWTDEGITYSSGQALSILPGVASYNLVGNSRLKIRHISSQLYCDADFKGVFELVDHDSTSGYIIDTYYGVIMPIHPLESRFEYFLAGGPRRLLDFDYYNPDYALGVGDSGELLFLSRRSSQEPPSICYGLTPNDNTMISGRDITFSWTEPNVLVPTDEYQIEISEGDTSNIVFSQSGIDSTRYQATGLEEEKTYYWRVRGHNIYGWGQFTGWVQFFLGRELYSFTQSQIPDSLGINAIAEATDSVIWIAGNGGFIAKTSNFGLTWDVVPTSFNDDFKDCYINPWSNSIQITTKTGELIYSNDNGSTWQKHLSFIPGAVINSITFSSASDGYLCGTNGLIARSIDGGISWIVVETAGTTTNLNSIFYSHPGIVNIAGDRGIALHSVDYARNFTLTEIFSGDNYKFLFSQNDKLSMMTDHGVLKASSDLGLTWHNQSLNYVGNISDLSVGNGRFNILVNNNLFTSTTDGNHLSFKQLLSPINLSNLYFTNSGKLIIAGDGSTVLIGDTLSITSVFEEYEFRDNPVSHQLLQNYPNPFNGSTVIPIYLKEAADVKLDVYNMLGEKVMSLMSGEMAQGAHFVKLDATNLPSGIYFYRIRVGGLIFTKKLILLK